MDSDRLRQQQLDDLLDHMIVYDKGDPMRIQHFIKVHELARLIGIQEKLDASTLFILEAAAYTHDIGIHVAEEKYGRCDGALQEQEGPAIARQMLLELGFENSVIERVCYLIGHHHTYYEMDGQDYQILVEADFLVNLFEDHADSRARENAYHRIFRTEAGKRLFCLMFAYREEEEEE